MPVRPIRLPCMPALLLAACLGGAPLQAAAQAEAADPGASIHGVRYAPRIQLGANLLLLNGAGTRYRAVFPVYAAGLYLEQPAHSLPEVLALPGPKRLSVTMLRDIDSEELGRLFARGMQDNLERASLSRLVPGVLRMSEIFTQHKKLLAGESFMLDWIPGLGLQVTIKGQLQGEAFQEPEFFQAMLGIWLGPHPADAQLKKALLGEAP